MTFEELFEFERLLAEYTGSPFAVATDCCTHAIELCLRYDQVTETQFTYNTYLSIPMLMHQLGIKYSYVDDDWYVNGEYHFKGTRIYDSARRLEKGMYRSGTRQCLSFGFDKPLSLCHGGAILLDNKDDYLALHRLAYDGRDLHSFNNAPWQNQRKFDVGYHYGMRLETARAGIDRLYLHRSSHNVKIYPDLREIKIGS